MSGTQNPVQIGGDTAPAAQATWSIELPDLEKADLRYRINYLRQGVEVGTVRALSLALKMPLSELLNALGISIARFYRMAHGSRFSPSDSERIIGLAKLIRLVERMVKESGSDEDFDPAAWMGRWLRRPNRALGGIAPVEYLDTIEGQIWLHSLLQQQQSGAYA